jgi:predicted  nucleic acid-binding Zn-ribbon protein
MELKKEIQKINDKSNKLIKEKENIINELKEYKKKNDDLKKNINKYENSSNNFLNDVENLMKLYK